MWSNIKQTFQDVKEKALKTKKKREKWFINKLSQISKTKETKRTIK